jgi:hypothetical protein
MWMAFIVAWGSRPTGRVVRQHTGKKRINNPPVGLVNAES